MRDVIIGVDASRNKSGGAIDHIIGIFNNIDISSHKIKEIHIWSYKSLLDQLPDAKWLIKHSHPYIEKSIVHNLFWQRFILKKHLMSLGCDILFSSDASTVCDFSPFVTLSQDALSFEKGTIRKFLFTKSIFRMIAIYFLQISTIKKANGTIFLTKYAKDLVLNKTGNIHNCTIIPHGINDIFMNVNIPNEINFDDPVKIIYVSNYSMYKNQWEVVKAIDDINSSKIKVKLTLVGGGSGKAKKLTELAIDKMKYPCAVLDVGRCEHFKLPELIKEHDVFLFASSCETISITLLEGMASFKPIISSNKGPMPEVLGNSGVYFDPFSSVDISNAIREVINRDPKVNYKQAKLSYEKSQFYNWKTCAKNTWDFIEKTAKDYL